MLIEVKTKPGVFFKFNNRSSRLNLANVDIIHFDEREMFIKDGKPMPNLTIPTYARRPVPEKTLVKIIELKKWQPRTNFSAEDHVIYFTPEGFDEYDRIEAIIDKQTL